MRNGFVLVELLIVLAIVAILIAVAIPNYEDAQTRSHVAHARSELRTVATALESYALDHSLKYPSDAGNGAAGIWRAYASPPNSPAAPPANFTIGYELTTPLAYLSTGAPLRDPFRWAFVPAFPLSGRENFGFMNIDLRQEMNPGSFALTKARVGSWVLFSAGPDTFFNNVPGGGDYSNVVNIPRLRNYDPTNGLDSNGDIYRCYLQPDGAPEIVTNP